MEQLKYALIKNTIIYCVHETFWGEKSFAVFCRFMKIQKFCSKTHFIAYFQGHPI